MSDYPLYLYHNIGYMNDCLKSCLAANPNLLEAYRQQYPNGEIKVDLSDLSWKFAPHYASRQRIIVRDPYGEVKRGYVGMTTGWKPSYLLVHNTRSHGSSILLDDRYEIIGTVDRYR